MVTRDDPSLSDRAVLAYLLGSISPGIIISHRFGTDIRTQGSKSTGTTNMIRVMGWKYGLLTFWGDLLKASLAILWDAGWHPNTAPCWRA